MAMVTGVLAVLTFTTGPAAAISCGVTNSTSNGVVMSKTRTCRYFDGSMYGAIADNTYSSHLFYARQGNTSAYMSLTLRDTVADGKCAWIRTRLVNTSAPLDRYETSTCGAGSHRNLTFNFSDQYMHYGDLVVYVCVGQDGNCTEIWRAAVTP